MSKRENCAIDEAYYFCVNERVEALVNKNNRYAIPPLSFLVGEAFQSALNGENKKIKNPNDSEYEGFKSMVPRYGWPDRNGALWVPCYLGSRAGGACYHWNIENFDGSHEIFFLFMLQVSLVMIL